MLSKFLAYNFLRPLYHKRVTGLLYHVVSYDDLPHVKHLFRYKNPKEFEEDLVELSRLYEFISYDHLINKNSFSRNSIILTFDDGYKELYHEVYPILEKLKIPAVFFITTDFIDNKVLFHRNLYSLCIERIHKWEDDESLQSIVRTFTKGNDISINDFIVSLGTITLQDKVELSKVGKLLNIDEAEFLRIKKPYLTSDQIKTLAKSRFVTIGAHSITHDELYLSKNNDHVINEIFGSIGYIRSLIHCHNIPFAFPFTINGVIDDVFDALYECGKYSDFCFGEQNILNQKKSKHVIYRYYMDEPMPQGAVNHIKDLLIRSFKADIKNRLPFYSKSEV